MKSERRRDLLKMLHEGRAATQQDLVAALRAAGHDVTQATISRDLQEVGAIKVKIGDQVAYRLPDETSRARSARLGRTLQRELEEFAIDLKVAGNIAVIVTLPGHAAAIARAIDLAGVEGVVGTIAGDDTVFAATSDAVVAAELVDRWLRREPVVLEEAAR
ncbi:MAG: arginine repressor [Actinomycetota bacterium]|nr:arginine repressor [Actinomycetota bacterium]